jgi:hypothetical protein
VYGGLLSNERGCSADVGSIRSGVDAEHMHWIHVTYQVRKIQDSSRIRLILQVVGSTPLAAVHSCWEQWLEFFLE